MSLSVQSIGVLSPMEGTGLDMSREVLLPLIDQIPPEDRALVASYLRGGTVIFAFMEYTRDVIDDRFGVAGGSGLLSDGKYYWRGDAADYVEHYGIEVKDEALEYMRGQGWSCRPVDDDTNLKIRDGLLRDPQE